MILLEVCVDSPDGLQAAIAGGADRIELCSALAVGGLTPSPGLMALAATAPVPVYAMIRPREGDFVFGPADVAAMRGDIRAVQAAGLAGVVLGANRPDGSLDAALLAELIQVAGNLGATLHRAFDLVPDPSAALEAAIALGFARVLTSGGQRTAPEGAGQIAALHRQAAGRIAIMAGSGVTPETVRELVTETGVHEVHSSCSRPIADGAPALSSLGFRSRHAGTTDVERVRALKAKLHDREPHRS